MHLDNVEQASATWLHNRSVNAFENHTFGSDVHIVRCGFDVGACDL